MDPLHWVGTIGRPLRVISLFCVAVLSSIALGDTPAELAAPRANAERLLADALKQARRENKRVFLLESGPYCFGCRLMSRFLDRHKEIIEQDFVVLRLERGHDAIGDRVLSRVRAGEPGSIPWVAVMDADAQVLATSNDADGKNLGFPGRAATIDCFMRMLSSASQRMTSDQSLALEESLSHRVDLIAALKERDEAAAKKREEAADEDRVERPDKAKR